jgi:hypothetical protein
MNLDANEAINGLLVTVGEQAKEIALLKVQLSAYLKAENEENEDSDGGSKTVIKSE